MSNKKRKIEIDDTNDQFIGISKQISDRMAKIYINIQYNKKYGSILSWPDDVMEEYFLLYEGYFKIHDSKLARRLYKSRLGGDPPKGYLYVKKE